MPGDPHAVALPFTPTYVCVPGDPHAAGGLGVLHRAVGTLLCIRPDEGLHGI